MIIIFIVLGLLTIGGIIKHSFNGWEVSGFLISIISGVALVIALIVLPVNFNSIKSDINQYNIIKQTILESRTENISDIERAALTTKIIETNQWLVNTQYWNETIFDIYIPDEIMKLKPLK